MKDIVLINNKLRGTGIGNYSYNLFAHLKTNTQRNLDFITLNSPSEDNFGSVRVFPQKMMRMVRHSTFISKISHSYKVYHLLNPNLGMFLSKCRPSVVTVFDIAALLPKVSREIIAQSYGLDLPEVFAMQMNMRFIKNADRILCMSLNTRKDLTSVLGIDTKRIIVGYPGINRALFSPRDKKKSRMELSLPINKQIILHVGVDEPRKNISTLIQAFRYVKKKFPDTVLVRVGGMRESTRKLISSLGLTDSVFHFWKVPNVAMFYNAADLLVFPSYYEGFGYPIAEAMASGCPVVAADSSSIPEVVGTKGILFPPSDVTRLYETVIQVLTDSTMRLKMTENGFEQCLKFDWETCARTTLKAYEALSS